MLIKLLQRQENASSQLSGFWQLRRRGGKAARKSIKSSKIGPLKKTLIFLASFYGWNSVVSELQSHYEDDSLLFTVKVRVTYINTVLHKLISS